MNIKAPVKLGKKTKLLIDELQPGDIAIIHHRDLDEIAARSLIKSKVSAVINCDKSISGRYPNLGPKILIEKKIPIFDVMNGDLFSILQNGDIIEIQSNIVSFETNKIAELMRITSDKLNKLIALAEKNLKIELEKFIDNTLAYAQKEKYLIMGNVFIPKTKTSIKNKHVLIVVRGQHYKEDLNAILPYIKEKKPVLIGVDGGADALYEFGFKPNIIIGDMDSVSNNCLKKCDEIIVHAYPNGLAPGMERIQNLDLKAKIFPAPGTSEDIAMLLAYSNGADLIVVLGSHTNMIDFLEKGRKGMGSTFLVRLKIGSKLIDARGVSQLYNKKVKLSYVASLLIAALIPIAVIIFTAQPLFFRLIKMKLRLFLDF